MARGSMLVLNLNTGLSLQWETREGYFFSEEGRRRVFWIWSHKLPTVSLVGRLTDGQSPPLYEEALLRVNSSCHENSPRAPRSGF